MESKDCKIGDIIVCIKEGYYGYGESLKSHKTTENTIGRVSHWWKDSKVIAWDILSQWVVEAYLFRLATEEEKQWFLENPARNRNLNDFKLQELNYSLF